MFILDPHLYIQASSTSFTDGKQVTVGLFRLSEGTITWSGYEPITWKGNFVLPLLS